ncbi:hypothetical protein M9Y10_031412 [Tritrichomonas musculus]|uniref:Uncharacterized protein n=1 Tax=Tritrichomonas musculus TaxID=1915356 RepID=A0ABR2H0J1_9EUKA
MCERRELHQRHHQRSRKLCNQNDIENSFCDKRKHCHHHHHRQFMGDFEFKRDYNQHFEDFQSQPGFCIPQKFYRHPPFLPQDQFPANFNYQIYLSGQHKRPNQCERHQMCHYHHYHHHHRRQLNRFPQSSCFPQFQFSNSKQFGGHYYVCGLGQFPNHHQNLYEAGHCHHKKNPYFPISPHFRKTNGCERYNPHYQSALSFKRMNQSERREFHHHSCNNYNKFSCGQPFAPPNEFKSVKQNPFETFGNLRGYGSPKFCKKCGLYNKQNPWNVCRCQNTRCIQCPSFVHKLNRKHCPRNYASHSRFIGKHHKHESFPKRSSHCHFGLRHLRNKQRCFKYPKYYTNFW